MMMGNLLGEDLERLKQVGRNPHVRTQSAVTSLDLSENPLGVTGARWIAMLLDPDLTS